MIQDYKGNGTVVEVHDVTSEDLAQYDMYEGINVGLYERVKIDVDMDSGDKIKTWVYVAGQRLLDMVDIFEEILFSFSFFL